MWGMEGGLPLGLTDLLTLDGSERLELEEPVDKEELVEMEKVYTECNRAAHMAFVDNHNAGYYINSYTTKLNPTMDNVLKKLLDSVRRLQSEWQESAAAKEAS